MKNKRYFDRKSPRISMELIISLVIIMVTTLGSTIPLYMQSNAQISAIHAEIKDFHGRLCAIESRAKQ